MLTNIIDCNSICPYCGNIPSNLLEIKQFLGNYQDSSDLYDHSEYEELMSEEHIILKNTRILNEAKKAKIKTKEQHEDPKF